MKTYTAAQLDRELARRKRFPPDLYPSDRAEWTTVGALRAELDATPLRHPDREWREWELALAERQAVTEAGKPFYRIVPESVH
jgi:hypothetical protein